MMMSSGGPIKRYQQLVESGRLREDSHQKGMYTSPHTYRVLFEGGRRLIGSGGGSITEIVPRFIRLQAQRLTTT